MNTLTMAILSALALLCAAVPVFADGCFVWDIGADLMEPEQVAVLHHDGTTETLVLRVKYRGEASEFAWVVPVPSVPDVEVVEQDEGPLRESLFTELGSHTQSRERARAWRSSHGGITRRGTEGVEVIEEKRAGIYDIAVLRADDANPLLDWLNERGFSFPSGRADVLDHYIRKGWVFVASRIAAEELTEQVATDVRVGDLQPLILTFASDRMVYPLRMSCLNAGEMELLVYALAATPMVPAAGPKANEISLEHSVCRFRQLGARVADPEHGTYARADSSDIPMTWGVLQPAGDGLFICKYRAVYQPAEMTDDLTFDALEAVEYWTGVCDTTSDTEVRALASWVLAWHDPSTLDGLAASSQAALRSAAAYSEKAPPELLTRLASDSTADVRWMVGANRSAPPEVLMALAADDDLAVRKAVSGNPSAPVGALKLLSLDDSRIVRMRVGSHPSMCEDIWRMWVESPDHEMRLTALRHREAPPFVSEELAGDEHTEVRRHVAYGPTLSSEVRLKLAKDLAKEVRGAVAQGCDVEEDRELLDLLAADTEWSVRAAVAGRYHLPVEMLVRLADDPHFEVRERVAQHVQIPEDVIRKLASDEVASVRFWVALVRARSADLLVQLADDPDVLVRRTVGHHEHTPHDVLAILATDDEKEVRESVARNRNTTPGLLTLLADDPHRDVRYVVGRNRNTPSDILAELAGDADHSVRWGVAGNEAAPDDVLLGLLDCDEDSREKARMTLLRRGYDKRELDKHVRSLAGEEE